MPEAYLNILLRLALFLTLTATFGVALFGLHALGTVNRPPALALRFRRRIGAAATLGIALSLWGMLELARLLSGVQTLAELSLDTVHVLVTGTAPGIAWCIRMLALAACALLSTARMADTPRLALMSVTSGIALATLAWSGHGAMHDDIRGYIHLGSDIIHLWAAGAWIGALIAFLMLAHARHAPVAILSRTSLGFARTGTAIVATLILTGSVN